MQQHPQACFFGQLKLYYFNTFQIPETVNILSLSVLKTYVTATHANALTKDEFPTHVLCCTVEN